MRSSHFVIFIDVWRRWLSAMPSACTRSRQSIRINLSIGPGAIDNRLHFIFYEYFHAKIVKSLKPERHSKSCTPRIFKFDASEKLTIDNDKELCIRLTRLTIEVHARVCVCAVCVLVEFHYSWLAGSDVAFASSHLPLIFHAKTWGWGGAGCGVEEKN